MKRLGPELKKPEMKAPQLLTDLYWDLRDRRLLPLVGLVVVAIAAVPFLLGSSPKEAALAPTAVGANPSAAQPTGTGSSSLVIAQAKPGLRDYRKRLKHRKPTNPFKQHTSQSHLAGAQLQPKSSSSSNTSSSETPSGGGESPSGGESSGGAPGGTPHVEHELTFYTTAINVKITKHGEKPVVKERVLPQTPLPGEKAPVVTYMGPATKDDKATGKALFLVSDQVRSVFGEAHCVSGDEVCQLLEVEPGFPVTLVYGENEVRYTIDVLKIGLVVTGHKKFTEARMESQNFTK